MRHGLTVLRLRADAPPALLSYSFDVTEDGAGSINVGPKTLFAYVDTGVPDGLKVDTKGNLYVGCGVRPDSSISRSVLIPLSIQDGVHVFSPVGVLLGKIYLGGMGSANLAFVGEGKLVILSETKIFLAQFAAAGVDLWN